MKLILLVLFMSVGLIIPNLSLAISGACSFHDGINCDVGRIWDGRVKCNDGSKDSSVRYDDMIECNDNPAKEISRTCWSYIGDRDEYITEIDKNISNTMYKLSHLRTGDPREEQDLKNSLSYLNLLKDRQLQRYEYMAVDLCIKPYLAELKAKKDRENDNNILPSENKFSPEVSNAILCTLSPSSALSRGILCEKSKEEKSCITRNVNFGTGEWRSNKCICNSGYVMSANDVCITDNKNRTPTDLNFSKRLSGRILLQVESYGEAYYVNPDNYKRYYLGRPADAFKIMRELALGVSHEFVISHIEKTFPDRVVGKILLDVGNSGMAYYIYPLDKRAYYLGSPQEAFNVMKWLGKGILNSDLDKIEAN